MKCYGDFICTECNVMMHKTFNIESMDEIKDLKVRCVRCDKETNNTVPSVMKLICRTLINKGYHVVGTYQNTLGVVFYPKIDIESLGGIDILPLEFGFDSSDEKYDLILNDRLRANDFEGMSKTEYINNSITALFLWAKSLPEVGAAGIEINLDELEATVVVNIGGTDD